MILSATRDSFYNTLKKSRHEQTSIPFIKHSLSSAPIVRPDEEFQTLTIGGSVCQSDRMKLTDSILSLNHKVENQPSFLTDTDFLEYLEHVIEPTVSIVALNFAYPLTPIQRGGLLDGILVSGSKENTFDGLIGKPVGETIEEYFMKKRGQSLRVSVANDTICLLLSGLTKYSWDNLAAGIVGTGLNFALFLDRHTAVNLESANFNAFDQSEEGKIIDASSASSGDALFEKEVSGAYLYMHYNIKAEKAGVTGRIQDTKELDSLASSTDPKLSKEKDIALSVLTHSAQKVACQIAGIMDFQQRDLTFVMQGSLFWKGYEYKKIVKNTTQQLSKYTATFVTIENADLLGASKLVT